MIMNELPSDKKREMFTRAEEPISEYGCEPEKRPLDVYIDNGVLNLDKPAGPTSHEVVAWVKRILDIRRAGHSGTLDPHVTGDLPIMLGNATKAVSALLKAGKEYVCVMKMHASNKPLKIEKICNMFVGPIYQRPPLVSAVKRQTRVRTIYYFDVHEIDDRNVLFTVGCEAGTYIRKLCHDIGEVLGQGAHMQELRRSRTGPFTVDSSFTLQDLKDAWVEYEETGDESQIRTVIHPMESALVHLPHVVIRESAVDALCHGASLAAVGILTVESDIEPEDLVAVMTQKGEAVMLGIADMTTIDMLNAKNGIAVTSKRVIMAPNTYPKGWTTKEVKETKEA